MRTNLRAAISLVEVLVAIVIVLMLAALVTPTIRTAMHRSNDAVVINNLGQSAKALLIYAQGYDDRLPDYSTAAGILPPATLCDPADHWRPGCKGPAEAPRVGSFGYVRGLEGLRFSVKNDSVHDTEFSSILITKARSPLLVSIFRDDHPPDPYPYDLCLPEPPSAKRCTLPQRVAAAKVDGSVQFQAFPVEMSNGKRRLMSWSVVLLADPTKPFVEINP